MLAIKISAKLKQQFDISIGVQDLFVHTDIKTLAGFIESQQHDNQQQEQLKTITSVDTDVDFEFDL